MRTACGGNWWNVLLLGNVPALDPASQQAFQEALKGADPLMDDWSTCSKETLSVKIQSTAGAISAMMISVMLQTGSPLLLQFPLERPVFLREYTGNMYSSCAYFVSKAMIELPLAFLQFSIVFGIVYWFLGFIGPIMTMIFAAWLLSICSASLAIMLSGFCSTPEQASQLGPLVFVPQIMFSGQFIPLGSMVKVVSYGQYVAALRWTLGLVMYFETRDMRDFVADLKVQDASHLSERILKENGHSSKSVAEAVKSLTEEQKAKLWHLANVTREGVMQSWEYAYVKRFSAFDSIGEVWAALGFLAIGFLVFRVIGWIALRQRAQSML